MPENAVLWYEMPSFRLQNAAYCIAKHATLRHETRHFTLQNT